jgi:hypothetical protein
MVEELGIVPIGERGQLWDQASALGRERKGVGTPIARVGRPHHEFF